MKLSLKKKIAGLGGGGGYRRIPRKGHVLR